MTKKDMQLLKEGMYKFATKGKYGLCDKNQQEVLKPEYDEIYYIEKTDSFYIRQNGKFGLLDKLGKVLVPPKYERICEVTNEQDMGDGYEIKSEDGFGWLSLKGKEIIPPKFVEYKRLNEKYYIASLESYSDRGIYDLEGKEILPPDCHRIKDGGEGFIFVQKRVNSEYMWAIFDRNAQQMTQFQFGDVRSFQNGVALANSKASLVYETHYSDGTVVKGQDCSNIDDAIWVSEDNPNKLWGFMGENGKAITDFCYSAIAYFADNGLAPVQKGGKWGYIDRTGKEVITPQYDHVFSFVNGFARVIKGDKWGIIDSNNQVVIPMEYDSLGNFINERVFYILDSKWGYLDKSNVRYILQLATDKKRYLFKGVNGETAPEERPGTVRPFIDNSMNFEQEGKIGFMDADGSIFIQPIYEATSSTFWGGLAFVKQNGKWAFINCKGKQITPFIYDSAGFIMPGFAQGKIGDKMVLVSTEKVLTDEDYQYIGYKNNPYIKELSKRSYSPGGEWMWFVDSDGWFLRDILEFKVMTQDFENFSLLHENDKYTRPYLKTSNYDAVVDVQGNILVPFTREDPLTNLALEKPVFSRQSPKVISDAKIVGAKNAINENYCNVVDDYFIDAYYSSVHEELEGVQHKFLAGLQAAISEWIFWRIAETNQKYLNFEYAFKRLDALYASIYNHHFVKNGLDYEIGYCEKITSENYELSDKERVEIGVLDKLFFANSMFFHDYRYHGYNLHFKVVSTVVLVRMVLAPAKKKLFDAWLENVMQKGRKCFPTTYTPIYSKHRIYNLHLDDLVPREFFFVEDYECTKENNEKHLRAFIENIDWANNPYLNEEVYREKYRKQ